MKKPLLLFIFLLLFVFNVKGQNLVPNGDFEQYSGCPNDFNQLDSALYWINPNIATPDYFNQCNINNWVGVPINGLGYQPSHSGNAYAGILQYYYFPFNYREYVQVQLATTLSANNCYYFEMYLNSSNIARYITDAIGVYFCDSQIAIQNDNVLQFIPQINNMTGNLFDTLNWSLVSGSYVASGGENYLIIGNFKDDSNTSLIILNSTAPQIGAYVFIDDVSLTPCTAIEEQNQNEAIKIYPNPVKDELFVNCFSLLEKKEIKITDILGKEIYRDHFLTSDFRLPTSGFQSGIYFVEINDGKNILRKKFLKE